MSRKTIEAFGAAVLLAIAIPSTMGLLLAGLPEMIVMATGMALLVIRNVVVLVLVAIFAVGHWLALQERKSAALAPDKKRKDNEVG